MTANYVTVSLISRWSTATHLAHRGSDRTLCGRTGPVRQPPASEADCRMCDQVRDAEQVRASKLADRGNGIVVAKYFTITCVADWMWFLLALDHDLDEYLEIVEARPDPRDYLPSMVYGGGPPI